MRTLLLIAASFAAGYITARGVKDSDNKTIKKINDKIDGWFDDEKPEGNAVDSPAQTPA